MSQFVEGSSRTFKSVTDLSAKLYYIVKISAQNTVALASAATDFIVGVINAKPAVGTAANPASVDVRLRTAAGTSKVILGGTVTRGDNLTSDANGKAITTTTAADEVLGRALDSGVTGDIIEFLPATQKYAVS